MKKLRLQALAAAMALGLVLTGAPAHAAEASSEAPESFITGAMTVSGLTRDDARRAWHDGRRNTIGVFSEEYTETSVSAATPTQIAGALAVQSLTMSQRATIKQKTIKTTRVIRSWAGIDCAGLTVHKTFLYDNKRVWRDTVTLKPWANMWQGWQYEGVTYQSDQYGAISGVKNRKHISERHAKFTDAWGTPTQVAISQEGRYNGSATSSGRLI